MDDLPRVNKYPPRELFPKEDTDFTPWLENNIDRLSDELKLSLAVIERERDTPTGFSIDLFIEEEESGQEGVIECQLEESDHDHLGKLLTYSSAFETELLIWIVQEARYEHQITVDWLNEATEKLFYLVKLETVEVNGSKAPLFTVLGEPSPEVKNLGESKREPSERDLKQEQFWKELLDSTPLEFDLFDNISPKQRGNIGKSSGVRGISFGFRVRNHWASSYIYIDPGDKDLNEEIFDDLFSQREEIEAELSYELEWQRLEDSRACRIQIRFDSYGLEDEDQWLELQKQMIEAMQELHEVFGPKIQDLSI